MSTVHYGSGLRQCILACFVRTFFLIHFILCWTPNGLSWALRLWFPKKKLILPYTYMWRVYVKLLYKNIKNCGSDETILIEHLTPFFFYFLIISSMSLNAHYLKMFVSGFIEITVSWFWRRWKWEKKYNKEKGDTNNERRRENCEHNKALAEFKNSIKRRFNYPVTKFSQVNTQPQVWAIS